MGTHLQSITIEYGDSISVSLLLMYVAALNIQLTQFLSLVVPGDVTLMLDIGEESYTEFASIGNRTRVLLVKGQYFTAKPTRSIRARRIFFI